MAVLEDGAYLIADSGNNRVRRVSADGMISTVAGSNRGLSGDDGPATDAQLNGVFGVAVTADGGFLIVDSNNSRVRKVSADGMISSVAGSTSGFSGDGGPAVDAQLSFPFGVAVTADGGFLIADTGNNRVRLVSAEGTISTVAGSTLGFSGDGGLATDAQLIGPKGVTITVDGGFLIADTGNNRVRRVAADGTITTIVGSRAGFSGDSGPVGTAQLRRPVGMLQTAGGGLLVVDGANNRLRFISAAGRIHLSPAAPKGSRGMAARLPPPSSTGRSGSR